MGPAIDAVVLCCLEKRPQRRFDGARSFAAALAEAVGRPAARSSPSPGLAGTGVAIYVELQIHTAEDDLDDALGRDLQFVLDRVEQRLVSEGFTLVQATGTGVLGVRPLACEGRPLGASGSELDERRRALEVACALHADLARRPTRDGRIHANILVHAGEILVRSADRPEPVGGALLRISAWAPEEARAGITATAIATQGISGFEEVTILEGVSYDEGLAK